VTAAWWPEGAPHPRRRLDEFATFELRALLRFADALAAEARGAEVTRVAAWRGELLAEQSERAEIALRPFAGNCR